jgi:polar amino acid transport system substrate-binding protein
LRNHHDRKETVPLKRVQKQYIFICLLLAMVMAVFGCTKKTEGPQGGAAVGGVPRLQQITQRGTLYVAISPDYAPFAFIKAKENEKDENEYAGADVMLAQYIAEKMGVTLALVPVPFVDIPKSLQEGRCDMAIAAMEDTQARRQEMDFSIAYMKNEDYCFLIRAADAGTYTELSALNTKDTTVLVKADSPAGQAAEKALPLAERKAYVLISDAIDYLKEGDAEAVAVPTGAARGYVVAYQELAETDFTLQIKESQCAVALPTGEAQLLEEVNRIVQEAVSQDLYAQWFTDAVNEVKQHPDYQGE